MSKLLTDDQIAEVQVLRNKGMIYRKIGNILGVSYKTISYALNPELRERIRLYSASYRKSHKKKRGLYNKSYYQDHKEESRFYQAAYYKAHKEGRSLRDSEYYKANKKRILLFTNAYRKAHLSECAARESVRRTRINNSTTGDLAQIKEIYRIAAERPKVRCYLCNKLIRLGDRHVDHILPVAKGGLTKPSNLAITCSHCNQSKGAKHPNELGLLI